MPAVVLRAAMVMAAAALIAACSVQYKMVGQFDDYNELILGDLDHDLMLGVARITAKGQNSGIVCRGTSEVTYIPPNAISCRGQRGVARVSCDDGRVADAEWVARSCTRGYGYGETEDGSTFRFAFGLTENEARLRLSRMQRFVADKPDLPVYRPKQVREEKGYSTGTGFFISESGHLVTNYHVVEDAGEVAFVTAAGEAVPLRILASDPANDVVVAKAEIASAPIPLAAGAAVARGEEVMTLGYPLITLQGQEQKATFGRINALSGIRDDIRFLQTDVPIQPGNSGGPLINSRGQVIGVVTQTLSVIVTMRQHGALPQNVNYALKSDYVLPLVRSKLGAALPNGAASAASQSMADLVRQYEKSVVLIVAR